MSAGRCRPHGADGGDAGASERQFDCSAMFDSLRQSAAGRIPHTARRGAVVGACRRVRAARDPHGAARGGRQFQGRQGVHRSGARAGRGAGRAGAASRRPSRWSGSSATNWSRCLAPRWEGSRPPRPRRASSCCSPAGLGQDHDRVEAGKLAHQAGAPPAAGVHRRAPPGAIEQLNVLGRQAASGCTTRRATSTRCPARRARWSRPATWATTWSSSTRRAGCTSTTR